MKACRLVFIYDFYVKDTGHFRQEIQKDVTVTRAPETLSPIQSHMKVYITIQYNAERAVLCNVNVSCKEYGLVLNILNNQNIIA